VIGFTKVHGNGNDFIVLENLEARYSTSDLSRFARLLCRRNFSIGADGILVAESGSNTNVDFAMRIFNADGSEGEMCGNGARALARYAFEKKLAGSPMLFTTMAGPIRATVEPPYAELDMGEIPLCGVAEGEREKLSSHGMEFPFVFLNVGVPHCVLFMEDYLSVDDALKFGIGRQVSRDFKRFPKGANVSFAQATSDGEAIAVTYERGVEDLTKSCGTGCVAVAIALARTPEGCSVTRVRNPGGVNEVRLSAADKTSCHAWLKGRTAIVAEGVVLDDAMSE
jgi:diaminopimelate epimerase